MASSGSEDGDFGFQIAPMIDVVFVLMIFFMAITGQQITEKELGINLPSGRSQSQGTEIPKTPIIIVISDAGQVSIVGRTENFGTPGDRNLLALRAKLKDLLSFSTQKNPDPVIIRPSSDSKHERVMDVLNAAAASGVKSLSFS